MNQPRFVDLRVLNKLSACGWYGQQDLADVLKCCRRAEVADALIGINRLECGEADRLILRAVRESKGTALVVSDSEILACQQEIAISEGILAAPEGAASLAALKHLLADGQVDRTERVVLFNTGSGLKYLP